jgi:HK97 family phage portal protein
MASWTANIAKRFGYVKRENRNVSLADGDTFLKFFGIDLGSVTVTESSALGLSALYRCVYLIASTLAQVPLKVFKENENGDNVVDKSHPNSVLLSIRPNEYQSSYVWRMTLWVQVLIHGNAIVIMNRGRYGRISSLELLNPSDYSFIETATSLLVQDNKKNVVYSQEDFIHIRDLSLGGKIGRSRVGLISKTLTTQMRAEAFLDKYYEKGTFLTGYIKSQVKLGKSDKDELSNDWDANYSGLDNNFRTPVMGLGSEYVPLGKSNVESQLMEFLNMAPTKIYQVFGTPPTLASDTTKSTSFGKGIEDLMIQFLQFTVLPLAVNFEQEVNWKAFRTAEIGTWYVKHNLNSLQRADFVSRMEGYSKAIQNGIMSPNDTRKLEDQNGYDGGQAYMVNGNMQLVKDVAEGNSIMKQNNGNDTGKQNP